MQVLQVAALVVYTFGAFAYAALLAMSLRQQRRGTSPAPHQPEPNASLIVGLALWTVSCLWFVINLVIELAKLGSVPRSWPLELAALWLACSFPPLIVHVTWVEAAECRETRPARAWGLAVPGAYVLAFGLATLSTLGFLGVGNLSPDTVGQRASMGLILLFIAASIYAVALLSRTRQQPRSARAQQSYRWHVALFATMGLLFFAILRLSSHEGSVTLVLGRALEIVVKSAPIAFMFAATYFEYRFEFFDLFIKRGLSLIVTIGVLVATFAVALPWLHVYQSSWAAPWVYAIALLPIALVLPWLHARLNGMLDRRWLGRRFSTVDAVSHFFAGMRSATSEAQLIARAETGLSEIFDAPAAIVLEGRPAAHETEFGIVERADIQIAGRSAGRILMGGRRSEAPYFSEDIALLGSLADVLASVLDNVRLQQREQEQDRTARELSLHASRSELKALRARINPHFLFNALNAIAGLIHRDPDVADRTVEKLADVFRYTLRGSESEWALLDDELEFVRAYLDVERARFGARLSTHVGLDEAARGARIPTMIVQTLVENAVKHGVAAVRGHAVVSIEARRERERLVIVVEDNGPGLDAAKDRDGMPATRGGFGLASVRQRLAGHFGTGAVLSIERDVARAVTRAFVTLPFLREDPVSPAPMPLERVGP